MTLPTPPNGTAAYNSRVHDGTGRISHLQMDLLHLVHGVTGAAASPEESAALLVERGIDTQAAAGRYVHRLVREHYESKGLRLAAPFSGQASIV